MKSLLLTISLFVYFQFSWGQEITVNGHVTGEKDGLPIPGVTVLIKGTSNGTITNIDGDFSINVPNQSSVLVFSSIGMKTQEIIVGDYTDLKVLMVDEVIGIDEVVVVGYGVENRRDVTGSVASVTSESFEKQPVQSLEKIIQGRAAGVQVTSESGAPGSGISVRIRGIGSINADNSPLYIVDGIQMHPYDLNPNDIESMDILKDAASASIYGAQAANGVVIITTKNGKEGKTKFNFQASEGVTKVIRRLDILNSAEFMELSLEAMENYVRTYRGDREKYYDRYYWPLVKDFEDYGLVVNEDGSFDYSEVDNYDWQDEVFRTGRLRDYQLDISGGNEKTKFFVSGSYHKTEGQVIGSEYERYTLRSNIKHRISKKLDFSTRISLSNSDTHGVSEATAYSNPYRTAMLMVPFNSPYNEDGSFNEDKFYGNYDHNVVMEATYNTRQKVSNRLSARMEFNYEILKDLMFRSTYSVEYSDRRYKKIYDPRTKDGRAGNGSVAVDNGRTKNLQTEQTLNYIKQKDKHKVNILLGFSYRHESNLWDGAYGKGLPNHHFKYVSSTAIPDGVSEGENDWKMAGMFSRVNYNYDGKYIVNLTLRRDGSSRFGEETKWGIFPSASFAWRLSSESFMNDITILDDLKLKASYGVTGNTRGIGDYSWRKLYSAGGAYFGQPSIVPTSLGNAELTWEQNKSLNFGVDFSLFSGRLRGGVDLYQAIRDQLLYTRPLPLTTGYGGRTENVGKVENKGFEIYLNAINLRKGQFEWGTSFNISHNKNTVKELIDGADEIGNSLKVGEPVNTYRDEKWAGVNPADGRPMFYDKDGNITYEPKDEDRVWVGNMDPTFIGGFGTDLTYKNWSLSALFQFQLGGKAYSSDFYRTARSGNSIDRNQLQSQYDERWQNPGDITWVAMPNRKNYYYDDNQSTKPYSSTTRNYLNTDYLRMKNIMLVYKIPKKITQRFKIDGLQVYAQATNLFTWTTFKGWDPEFTGSDRGKYPQGKNYSLGVKVSF